MTRTDTLCLGLLFLCLFVFRIPLIPLAVGISGLMGLYVAVRVIAAK